MKLKSNPLSPPRISRGGGENRRQAKAARTVCPFPILAAVVNIQFMFSGHCKPIGSFLGLLSAPEELLANGEPLGPLGEPLGAPGEALGEPWGSPWRALGEPLGSPWDPLRVLGANWLNLGTRFRFNFGPFWAPFWLHFGTLLDSKIAPKSSQKSIKK